MGETRSSRRYAGDVRNNFAASDEKPTFNRQRCDERKWMKPEGKRGVEGGGVGGGRWWMGEARWKKKAQGEDTTTGVDAAAEATN